MPGDQESYGEDFMALLVSTDDMSVGQREAIMVAVAALVEEQSHWPRRLIAVSNLMQPASRYAADCPDPALVARQIYVDFRRLGVTDDELRMAMDWIRRSQDAIAGAG